MNTVCFVEQPRSDFSCTQQICVYKHFTETKTNDRNGKCGRDFYERELPYPQQVIDGRLRLEDEISAKADMVEPYLFRDRIRTTIGDMAQSLGASVRRSPVDVFESRLANDLKNST